MRVDCSPFAGPHLLVAMARSTTTYFHKLEGYPIPEQPDEQLVDRYFSSEDSEVSTPTPRAGKTQQYTSHDWSDDTLAGSLTGRSSVDSWTGEYELDRIATERVARLFNHISKALYDGRGTGQPQVDVECKEWSAKFPHFQVQGEHLLDSYDDGTEIVSSTCTSARRDPEEPIVMRKDPLSSASGVGFSSITVIGRKMQPFAIAMLPDMSDTSELYEEIIAAEGVIEESFAFDNTDEDPCKKKRQSRLKHHIRLPPITPIACVRDTVGALVFDQLWEEVVGTLQPLLSKLRAEYSTGFTGFSHTSSHSSAMNQAMMPYLPSSYVLRPLEQAGFRLADEQSNYQMMLKRTPAVMLPTLPHNPHSILPQNGLEGVMKIKSVPLRQRTALPLEGMEEGTLASIGPTDSVVTCSRLGKSTPVVHRHFDQPPRLISGTRPPPGARKTIVLKPLDKPRTPALVPTRTPALVAIDDGIRGHRLHTASNLSHTPPIPPVRNTQLPPLDVEQSSPPIRRASAQRGGGGKVTFSRGQGTADTGGESWHLPRAIGGELRPNTTNTSRDPNSRQLVRKNSDHSIHFPAVVMKVVGHAAGLSSVGGGFPLGMTNTIVEDEEESGDGDGDGGGGVVANSSYVQPKPKSSRGKLRGHVR